jgi:hypothetical protein
VTTHFRVALFVDGRYEGVTSRARVATKDEARKLARRWRRARDGGDFRAVEFDATGFMVWKDEVEADALARIQKARQKVIHNG